MADTLSTLSDLETRLWTEGAGTYRELCSDKLVMAFADPAGLLVGLDAVMKELPEGGRWKHTEMKNASVAEHGDTAVLSYRMTAGRDTDNVEPFKANCVSVWRRSGDGWKQLSHGQVPADGLHAQSSGES